MTNAGSNKDTDVVCAEGERRERAVGREEGVEAQSKGVHWIHRTGISPFLRPVFPPSGEHPFFSPSLPRPPLYW